MFCPQARGQYGNSPLPAACDIVTHWVSGLTERPRRCAPCLALADAKALGEKVSLSQTPTRWKCNQALSRWALSAAPQKAGSSPMAFFVRISFQHNHISTVRRLIIAFFFLPMRWRHIGLLSRRLIYN